MAVMSDSEKHPESSSSQYRPIWLWLLIALVSIIGLTAGIVAILAWSSGGIGPQEEGKLPTLTALLSAAIPAAALAAAGAAGAVGIRRQRSLEDTYRLERQRHRLDESRIDAEAVARLRDRYTTAAEQLGSNAVAVRLAGVYALAALADDWLARGNRSEAQVCIDLLCAYFRVPPPPSAREPDGRVEQEARAEKEVLQTITRVISSHMQDPEAEASWCGMDLDFTGVVFAGEHSFNGAHFTGGQVSFENAQFTHDGYLTFNHARFAGGIVSFWAADFGRGDGKFIGAEFTGATVSFLGAEFTGATVSFEHARFNDGRVSFESAWFFRSEVDFNSALFADGLVDFANTTFDGGCVRFTGAEFTVDLLGPWGRRRPPEIFPVPVP
jgi:hypothetical protein